MFEVLLVRLTEIETRRTQIDAELTTAVVPTPASNASGLYAAWVEEREAAVNDPDLIVEATRTITSLVKQIVLDEKTANWPFFGACWRFWIWLRGQDLNL